MNLRRAIALATSVIASVPIARAQENFIYHYGNAPQGAYTIEQDDKTITIHTGGGYIFKF